MHSEITGGLKIYLLLFTLLLIGALTYMVVTQNQVTGIIYSSNDIAP